MDGGVIKLHHFAVQALQLALLHRPAVLAKTPLVNQKAHSGLGVEVVPTKSRMSHD